MMHDAEDLRQAPQTFRQYWQETCETFRVFSWASRTLNTPASQVKRRQYLWWLTIVVTTQLSLQWAISYIFNGLVLRNTHLLLMGFVFFGILTFVRQLAHWREMSVREWLLGLNMGFADHYITDCLFQKSMGQHAQESSQLSMGNIEKGRNRWIELQAMMLFHSASVLMTLLISFLFIWLLSPRTGLGMTIVMLIHMGWSFYLNQQVASVCIPIDKDFRHLNRHRLERWEKMERVKTCGQETTELAEMDSWWDRVLTADRTFWLWFITQCSKRGTINSVALLLAMAYGARLVWQGAWPIGTLYPFYAWITLFSSNLWQISDFEHKFNWAMPAVRALRDALLLPPDVTYPVNAPRIKPGEPVRVVFDRVSYAYPLEARTQTNEVPTSALTVMQDVSLEIEPGDKVALIGPSGAGKTTFFRLLMRFMDPTQGTILINGQDLREINLSSWMQYVGYIPQQAQVLDGTIRYNLLYGMSPEQQSRVTDEELWELMRLLQIDFGERLTDGLNTLVGRNGVKLSGGQAQRLMIGAAAIKRPLMYFADEPTSHLDSTTEKGVQDGLACVLNDNVSAVIVAHRLSSVRHLCNKFVVLRDVKTLQPNDTQVEAVARSLEALYTVSPTFRQLATDQDLNLSIRTVFDGHVSLGS